MEFSREIYWNVGHRAGNPDPHVPADPGGAGGAGLGLLAPHPGLPPGSAAAAHRRTPRPVDHGAAPALAQTRVLRVPGAGTAHGLFFWGFVLLFIGTCLVCLQADFAPSPVRHHLSPGPFYLVFSAVLDLAGAARPSLMLAGLAVRRYLVRPAGLETRRDDALMPGLLLAILVTGFFIEGARMAATELGTPAGRLVARRAALRQGPLRPEPCRPAHPARGAVVAAPAARPELHRPDPLHQAAPPPDHPRQLSLRRPPPHRRAGHPRSRGRNAARASAPPGSPT